MIDFTKNQEMLNDIKDLIQKNVEKSELERFYAYTIDYIEKAKVFIFCYRFFYNIYTCIEECDLKNQIRLELKINKIHYEKLHYYLFNINQMSFNARKYREEILAITLLENVDNIIDSFMILMEKSNIINIASLKGIVLEGKSKEEFKKIMRAAVEDAPVLDSSQDEDFDLPEIEINEEENINENETQPEEAQEDNESQVEETPEENGEESGQTVEPSS